MKQSKKELIWEMIRFLIVGGIATLVDYAVFYVCNLFLFKGLNDNVNLVLSTALGFGFGLLTNWFLQKFVYRYLTDKQTKSTKVFIKFLIISLIGLGITELGINLASPIYDTLVIELPFELFGIKSFQFWKLFMKVLMTIIVLIFNYIARKYFVFRVDKPEENLTNKSEETKTEDDKSEENNNDNPADTHDYMYNNNPLEKEDKDEE